VVATKVQRCPICGKTVDPAAGLYPFCSKRCKLIDLGNWASEKYVAHSPMTEADENLDSESPRNDD
jgi:endogenous inhibitor of DNA gyrase (YacG/DUF329 family)